MSFSSPFARAKDLDNAVPASEEAICPRALAEAIAASSSEPDSTWAKWETELFTFLLPNESIIPSRILPSVSGNPSTKAFSASSPGIFSSAYRAMSDVSGCKSIFPSTGTDTAEPISLRCRQTAILEASVASASDSRKFTSIFSMAFFDSGEFLWART